MTHGVFSVGSNVARYPSPRRVSGSPAESHSLARGGESEAPPFRRIVLVGPLPPPSGGMANQTLQLARLLEEAGIAVDLVQVNAPYRPDFVRHLRGVRAMFRLVPYVRRLWRAARNADLMHVMANSGWAWHLFAGPAVWVSRAQGVPVVVNYRGGDAERFLARRSAWVRLTLRGVAAVVVPSTFLEDVFAHFGITTEIVPNVIDLVRFHPAPERSAGHHLVVTRNLEDIYDIPTALRAFAEIRRVYDDARLTVAGSGPRLAALQALASELAISPAVRFTGRLDNAEIADLYRDADLVLNPSTVDNMPISLLEAMASGVPVVSTDVGGIPHLARDGGTMLLVPPRTPQAMAESALRVLGDPDLAATLRQAGVACAAAYAWPQVQPRLFAVYRKAVRMTTVRRRSP